MKKILFILIVSLSGCASYPAKIVQLVNTGTTESQMQALFESACNNQRLYDQRYCN